MTSTSIFGLSARGAFASQMHVAYSSIFMGLGSYALWDLAPMLEVSSRNFGKKKKVNKTTTK